MQFTNIENYHKKLVDRILALEKDSRYTHKMMIGGSKVADISGWGNTGVCTDTSARNGVLCASHG